MLKVGFGYTRLCNMRCIFCYSAHVKPVSWRTVDAEKLIQDIYEHHGVFDLNWGTGENILAPGFVEVVRFAHRLGVKQNITTNGSIVYKPEVLDYIEEVDVSIDHPELSVHNKLRGHPRAYQMAVEAARLAARKGATVTVTAVLLRYNADYRVAAGLVELARRLDARIGGAAVAAGLLLVARSAELYPRMTLLHEAMSYGIIGKRESVYLKTVLPNTFMCREACTITQSECSSSVEAWLGIGYAQQLYDDHRDGDDYLDYIHVACILWEKARRLAAGNPIHGYIEEYQWKFNTIDELCRGSKRR